MITATAVTNLYHQSKTPSIKRLKAGKISSFAQRCYISLLIKNFAYKEDKVMDLYQKFSEMVSETRFLRVYESFRIAIVSG
jgi:hypothetical protein